MSLEPSLPSFVSWHFNEIDLYEREGFFGKALDVARRAAAFQQGNFHLERLQERIASLEAEDAAADS
jgi:hypothetical protein